MDEHKQTTGHWPNFKSGNVIGTSETWSGLNAALKKGNRGLPGGSTLAEVLTEHRGVRHLGNLSTLTTEQILAWADKHKQATGELPRMRSGRIRGTDETWAGINHALRIGYRGLPGGTTLVRLLAEHRRI